MLLVNGDVTADPEPASPVRRVLLRQAILAELAGTATGWSTRQLTRRIAQASPELADVRPAVVSRELESLRTDGYTQGTAYPPAPVCWTLTEAGRLATTGASTP
jgi:DNA-binding HxlR family transcriptional regulator